MARLALAALLLAVAPVPASAQAVCDIAPADRAWLDQSIAAWRAAERELLKLAPRALPVILSADATCRIERRGGGHSTRWITTPHGGVMRFPGGGEQPIGPISFASPGAKDHGDYFAMTLPSVWRAAGVDSPLGLERMMTGVMLHEIMHTRQFAIVDPRMKAIPGAAALGDDLDDNIIQTRFGKDADYAAAYALERDALFAAAAAPSKAEARKLAARALKLMRERRARFFKAGEPWAELDDIFLDMEGLGQWVGYAWLTSPKGAGLSPETVLPAWRRGGKQWSQDQGLALFRVVDRLVPGWQKLAFAKRPLFAEALLARAAGE